MKSGVELTKVCVQQKTCLDFLFLFCFWVFLYLVLKALCMQLTNLEIRTVCQSHFELLFLTWCSFPACLIQLDEEQMEICGLGCGTFREGLQQLFLLDRKPTDPNNSYMNKHRATTTTRQRTHPGQATSTLQGTHSFYSCFSSKMVPVLVLHWCSWWFGVRSTFKSVESFSTAQLANPICLNGYLYFNWYFLSNWIAIQVSTLEQCNSRLIRHLRSL